MALVPGIQTNKHGLVFHAFREGLHEKSDDAAAVEGAEKFKGLVSVAVMGEQKGEAPLPDNESLDVEQIIALRAAGASEVREMPVE